MPIYTYKCEEGHKSDIIRKFSEQNDEAQCDTCGGDAANIPALPAPRSSPSGEVVTIGGQQHILNTADDRRNLLRKNGLQEQCTNAEAWGSDTVAAINENVKRIKGGAGREGLIDLNAKKRANKQEAFKKKIRSKVDGVRKKIETQRVCTDNIVRKSQED